MPKDLRSKVSLLVKDIEMMSHYDKIDAIERFMSHEFKMMEAPHNLTFNAVAQIHSAAARVMRDISPGLEMDGKTLREYPELVRTICFIQATYDYFRQEKLISYLL